MTDPNTIQQIQMRVLTAQFGELYDSIASELPAAEREAVVKAAALKLPSPREVGRAFYERTIRPAMVAGICGKAKFCKNRKLYDSAASLTGLVAEHAVDAVGKVHGLPPGSGQAAKLVVEVSAAALKEGLNELCDCPEM
jgi:hypothetical protein